MHAGRAIVRFQDTRDAQTVRRECNDKGKGSFVYGFSCRLLSLFSRVTRFICDCQSILGYLYQFAFANDIEIHL